jgi:CheY-like chemotaxis protein
MTHGLRILIVDDNADAADSLALVLKLEGHQPWVAYDSRFALLKAVELKPHAILHDIALPHLDGYQAARLIRQNPALRPVLLVAVTGNASANDHQRTRDAGFDHHFQKPIDLDRLGKILAGLSESLTGLQAGAAIPEAR